MLAVNTAFNIKVSVVGDIRIASLDKLRITGGLIENNTQHEDILELPELLMEDFDNKHHKKKKINSVELLQKLIKEGWNSQSDFVNASNLSPQLVYDIFHYRRRISIKTARFLASFFALKLDDFSKPYNLVQGKKKYQLIIKLSQL